MTRLRHPQACPVKVTAAMVVFMWLHLYIIGMVIPLWCSVKGPHRIRTTCVERIPNGFHAKCGSRTTCLGCTTSNCMKGTPLCVFVKGGCGSVKMLNQLTLRPVDSYLFSFEKS